MKLLKSTLVLTLVLATLMSCFALPVAATDDGKRQNAGQAKECYFFHIIFSIVYISIPT